MYSYTYAPTGIKPVEETVPPAGIEPTSIP